MNQKFSAGNVLTRTAAALARAAQTLEELCRMDEYCPYRHQPIPREWRLDECSKCNYSHRNHLFHGYSPLIAFPPDKPPTQAHHKLHDNMTFP